MEKILGLLTITTFMIGTMPKMVVISLMQNQSTQQIKKELNLYYKKIMFLGNENDFYSKISWVYDRFFGGKLSNFNCSEINKKIINAKIINPDIDIPRFLKTENYFYVQSAKIFIRLTFGRIK